MTKPEYPRHQLRSLPRRPALPRAVTAERTASGRFLRPDRRWRVLPQRPARTPLAWPFSPPAVPLGPTTLLPRRPRPARGRSAWLSAARPGSAGGASPFRAVSRPLAAASRLSRRRWGAPGAPWEESRRLAHQPRGANGSRARPTPPGRPAATPILRWPAITAMASQLRRTAATAAIFEPVSRPDPPNRPSFDPLTAAERSGEAIAAEILRAFEETLPRVVGRALRELDTALLGAI